MKPCILIADDDAASLLITRKVLSGEGYGVRAAKDGAEALDLAAKVQPALVIPDVMRPGLDGYEVCRHLRRKPATARVPVVMLTARDSLEAFEAMDYPRERVKLVLNQAVERNGLNAKEIEDVLHRLFNLAVPFAPEAVAAINLGAPGGATSCGNGRDSAGFSHDVTGKEKA